MKETDMRGASMTDMQRDYWNKQAGEYQASMRISVEDFHYGPQIPGESKLRLLPPIFTGLRALELGCGAAQNSIYLAKRGAICTAADISKEQIAHGKIAAGKEGVGINFVCTPLENLPAEVFGSGYDLIHSSHALEFVDDPGDVILKASSLLSTGGTLLISTVHPLYNGDWVESVDENGTQDGMGLFLRNYFSPPDDTRHENGAVEVVSRAYPVSTWFNWMLAAGLTVRRLEEPQGLDPEENPPYTNSDWADTEGELQAIPGTLIIVAQKAFC